LLEVGSFVRRCWGKIKPDFGIRTKIKRLSLELQGKEVTETNKSGGDKRGVLLESPRGYRKEDRGRMRLN